jgi:hypothetical protein
LVRINRLNSFTGLTPRANPIEIICKQQQQSIFQTTKITILVIVATPPPVTNATETLRTCCARGKEKCLLPKNWLDIGITQLNSFTGLNPRSNPVEIITFCLCVLAFSKVMFRGLNP